jgi:hypothetical protein
MKVYFFLSERENLFIVKFYIKNKKTRYFLLRDARDVDR